MEKLPLEMVLDIFYRLPPESIVLCKFVCKSWRNLLPRGDDDGNYFANMNLYRRRHPQQRNLDYSTLNFISIHEFRDNQEEEGRVVGEFHITEYDEVEGMHLKVKRLTFSQICISGRLRMTRLVGSCNGLLCLTITNERWTNNDSLKARICLCNPLLHEYVTPPLSDLQFQAYACVNTGFGHNPITDEYKVVRVYYRQHSFCIGDVEVYTLGKTTSSNCGAAGMWRSKGTIEYRLQSWHSPYVLINGSIHWFAIAGSEQIIVSFDLEDEEFRVIPLPSNVVNIRMTQLRELRGCLCLIGDRLPLDLNYVNLDIWVLKDYMNPKESSSWVKEFSIKWKGHKVFYWPYAIRKKKDGNGDEILLWRNKRLFSYDPMTQNCKEVTLSYTIAQDPVLHINSLVSLKALGEDAKYAEKWLPRRGPWKRFRVKSTI